VKIKALGYSCRQPHRVPHSATPHKTTIRITGVTAVTEGTRKTGRPQNNWNDVSEEDLKIKITRKRQAVFRDRKK
jgi:hypothetical protein